MFDRVFCVSLASRPDRWKRFLADLPADWETILPPVERFSAIDGHLCSPPVWWHTGKNGKMREGAWGCYRSHVRLLEDCITNGVGSVLVLEDDAIACRDFSSRLRDFMTRVPSNWGMLYLGGEHLRADRRLPVQIAPGVWQPYNVNRTHAFALRGSTMVTMYRWLCHVLDWKNGHHLDHHLGRLHEERAHPIYCPSEWLFGQNEESSDISSKVRSEPQYWASSASIGLGPFVSVIGIHRSGTSCVAGMLHRLGIHMGNRFTGIEPDGGYEADGLRQLCDRICPYPGTHFRHGGEQITQTLADWIRDRSREAWKKNTVAGGKYPTLCAFGKNLVDATGDGLYVVHCSRPLEESIESLLRRDAEKFPPERLTQCQRFMDRSKREMLATPGLKVLTVEYDQLLKDPLTAAKSIAAFLPVEPSEGQIADAASYVNPALRHVTKTRMKAS